MPTKEWILGDKIQLFTLNPVNCFLFLLILLISSGIFPKLLPSVNLNDFSSACNKDEKKELLISKTTSYQKNYMYLSELNTAFIAVSFIQS